MMKSIKNLVFVLVLVFGMSCSHSSKKSTDAQSASVTPNSSRTPAAAQNPVSPETYRVLDEIKNDMESTLQKGQRSIKR